MFEIPPAKQNKQKAPVPKKQANKKVPRTNLTNQRPVGRSTGQGMTKRVKGQYNVATVFSGERGSIYIDRIGLSLVFPLVSNFQYYEKYFVHGLELEFVPNQPVTVGGTIYVAPDYDPIDPFPGSLTALSNSFNFVQKPVTSGFRCKMPNFKLADGAYMRPSLYSGANNNDRLVCYGKFQYEASSSLTDGTSLGTFILHYDITFEVPQPAASDTVADQQIIALKSVCDNAGTVSPAPFNTGTNNDALLIYDAAHSAPATLNNAYTYAGIIEKLTGMTLETMNGKDVNPGTRVFMKTPEFSLVSDVLSPYVGALGLASIAELNISRSFDIGTAIKMYRAVDGWIDFSDMALLS